MKYQYCKRESQSVFLVSNHRERAGHGVIQGERGAQQAPACAADAPGTTGERVYNCVDRKPWTWMCTCVFIFPACDIILIADLFKLWFKQ